MISSGEKSILGMKFAVRLETAKFRECPASLHTVCAKIPVFYTTKFLKQ
jgi:hypothetical protein